MAESCERDFRMSESPIWVKAERDELKWLQHVFAEAQCVLHLHSGGEATFTRMLRDLQEGEKDLLLGASYTADRAKYLYFSPVYIVDKAILLTRNENAARWHGKEIFALFDSGANLLVPKHGWYGDAYERLRSKHPQHRQLQYYRHDKDALPDFYRSTADVVLTTTRVLNSQADKTWQSELTVLSPTLYEDELHIVFSKRSTLYSDVQIINRKIDELLAKGDSPASFMRANEGR